MRWLLRRCASERGQVRVGIGDDAALVSVAGGHDVILKADLSVEGEHYTRALHPPRSVGHRALARALSDIAAMGGTPRFALISLAMSSCTSRQWLQEVYVGLISLARRFDVAVIGGDTSVLPEGNPEFSAIDAIVAGEVPRRKALLRSGACAGDQIFVSGTLGLSVLGLKLLKSHRKGSGSAARQAIHAHLYPEPRCALGRFLCQKGLASAAIDISDGLSTDLRHLYEASGVGARIWADRIPRPAQAELDLALHGGEDYELLFTVPPRKVSSVPRHFQGLALHHIGKIVRPKGVLLARSDGKQAPLPPLGYDHFRKLREKRGQ